MNPKQAENLRILIRHMEANVKRVLDMQTTWSDGVYPPAKPGCGTPACAMGEASMVPQLAAQMFKDEPLGAWLCYQYADALFGTNGHLFGFEADNAWRRNHVTPQEWAAEARKVLAGHGYAMEDTWAADKVREVTKAAPELLNA